MIGRISSRSSTYRASGPSWVKAWNNPRKSGQWPVRGTRPLYLLEQEPSFLKDVGKSSGIDLEVRDDPLAAVDEFKLVSQPAGRDVTERYLVA